MGSTLGREGIFFIREQRMALFFEDHSIHTSDDINVLFGEDCFALFIATSEMLIEAFAKIQSFRADGEGKQTYHRRSRNHVFFPIKVFTCVRHTF